MAAKNETWLIVTVVVIAGVLIALSFTRDKKEQAVTSAVPSGELKPAHTPEDMQKIAQVKPSPDVVEMSKAVAVQAGFAVQVFSFKDKARADASLKQLKDKGYPAYIMMSDLGPRGVFYRVRVGSFATEEEAKKNLEAVTRDFKSGIIVTE